MLDKSAMLLATLFALVPGVTAGKRAQTLNIDTTHTTIEAVLETQARAGRQRASTWVVFPGDWRHEMDAVAVAHTGTQPTELWVHQRTATSEIIDSARITETLLPDGRAGYIIGGPDHGHFETVPGSHFLVSSTQALSLRHFRGQIDSEGNAHLRPISVDARNEATVTRDDRHVWFIEGGSIYDMTEMQGYLEASDRLWQGVFYKHVSSGRLAELFGPSFVSQDALVRTAGFSDQELDAAFEAMDPESKDVIQGYVDGFNRRIAEVNTGVVPPIFEFAALGITQIEPWSHRDVLTWLSVLQRNFSSLGDLGLSQVENGLLLQQLTGAYGNLVGIAAFQDLRWTNDPQAPTMIPASPEARKAAARKQAPTIDTSALGDAPDLGPWVRGMRSWVDDSRAQLDKLGAKVKGGSYAWVVSGDRTDTGNPIIYSGPQMGFEAPAIVMEGSFRSDEADIHASGMTVIGIPMLIIARTPHHAWSMQVGHTNTWDWYLESEETVSVHRAETIAVAGGEDVTIPVLRSARGPVFEQAGLFLSWKYASFGKEWESISAILKLLRAESMAEFGEGVAGMQVTQHYCYADRDGNIAYWMSGQRPVRQPGEYRVPQGLLGPALEWDADITVRPPHDANPAQGFYAGWNNKAAIDVDDTSSNYLYGRYHRAEVVQKYLREAGTVSYEDLKNLAINISATQAYSSGSGSGGGSIWPWLRDAFTQAVANNPTPDREAALAILDGWDEHRVAGGMAGWIGGADVADAWLLLNSWAIRVNQLVFNDELGSSGGNSFRLQLLIRELHPDSTLKNSYRLWARNQADPSAPQTIEAAIITALDETLATWNLDARPWGTGMRGTLEYDHPLLGVVYDGTPWAARSTYAHCIEFDALGPVRIESTFPLGQDGTFTVGPTGEPIPALHNFSMVPFFDTFTLLPFPLFDR